MEHDTSYYGYDIMSLINSTLKVKPVLDRCAYLLEHRRVKVWKKHLHIKHKIEHPEKHKGKKVYMYGYDKYGDVVFSSKSKREGLYAVTLNTALELRRITNGK